MTEIERRLQEWARWVSVRRVPGHCRSIEFRYLHPRWRDDQLGEPPLPPPLPPVDTLAALDVERTMRFLPIKHRKALRLHYVYRRPWLECCQRLALRYDRWEGFIRDARLMCSNRLQANSRHAKVPALPADSDTLSMTLEPLGSECNAEADCTN